MSVDNTFYGTLRTEKHCDTSALFLFGAGSNPLTATQAVAPGEIQVVTIGGVPTGGTFTLTVPTTPVGAGGTTAAIAYNAAASAVQTALAAVAAVGATANVNVAGSAGGPYTLYFTGALAALPIALLTASGASLTGGTNPSVVVTESSAGLFGIDTTRYSELLLTLNLTLTGTSPSYTFKLQTSDDGGTTWFDLPAAGYQGGSAPAAITATGKAVYQYIGPMGSLVRSFVTVTGTTPSATGTANFAAK